jgi:hypothetical protein
MYSKVVSASLLSCHGELFAPSSGAESFSPICNILSRRYLPPKNFSQFWAAWCWKAWNNHVLTCAATGSEPAAASVFFRLSVTE